MGHLHSNIFQEKVCSVKVQQFLLVPLSSVSTVTFMRSTVMTREHLVTTCMTNRMKTMHKPKYTQACSFLCRYMYFHA